MPSHTFNLARSDASASDIDILPGYIQHTKPPSYFAADHARSLSVIMEDDEDEAQFTGSASQPWNFRRLVGTEQAIMMPQALLVDASTTLCAYLYFTSLQARLTIEQHNSLDLLRLVCAALPGDTDASAFNVCAGAIARQKSLSFLATSLFLSHHLIILAVFVKAAFGFAVLHLAPRYIKPFDYLVASGATHCLLLYCCFFVPVANLLIDAPLLGATVWLRVMTKFFWLLAICSSLTLLYWFFGLSSSKQAIKLPDGRKDMEEKDASALV